MKQSIFLCLLFLTPFFLSAQKETPKTDGARNNTLNFAYPVIFVHGLNSSHETWLVLNDYLTKQRGWSFGDLLKFNLNFDNNSFTCNALTDYRSFAADATGVGDLYYVTFKVDGNGSAYAEDLPLANHSNQAGIYKQGLAIRDAVKRVLELTGRDKVVLFGHSMGGLAIRQYVQSTEFWQADGKHHVAKVITTGTPHLGTALAGNFFGDFIVGIDAEGEASRDLNDQHRISGHDGVFLFGGRESRTIITGGYHNIDVNCNGLTNEHITGLNNKPFPTELEYTFIRGEDDILVARQSAIPTVLAAPLIYEAALSPKRHTKLPEDVITNHVLLDEADHYSSAYRMPLNTYVNGYISAQGETFSPNSSSHIPPTDLDIYQVDFPAAGSARLTLGNAGHEDFTLSIVDANNVNTLFFETLGNWGEQTFDFTVSEESVYIVVDAKASNVFLNNPYFLRFDYTPDAVTSTAEVLAASIKVFPNPTQGWLQVETTQPIVQGAYRLHNVLGQLVAEGRTSNGRIDLTGFGRGVYVLSVFEDGVLVGREKVYRS